MGTELTVYVTEFSPMEGDVTAYIWNCDNTVRKMEMPDYCLANLDTVKKNLIKYMGISKHNYLWNLLGDTDDTIWDTFTLAIRFDMIGPVRPTSYQPIAILTEIAYYGG